MISINTTFKILIFHVSYAELANTHAWDEVSCHSFLSMSGGLCAKPDKNEKRNNNDISQWEKIRKPKYIVINTGDKQMVYDLRIECLIG